MRFRRRYIRAVADIYREFIGLPAPVIVLLMLLACFLACCIKFGIHP